jgi:hypothetical protein
LIVIEPITASNLSAFKDVRLRAKANSPMQTGSNASTIGTANAALDFSPWTEVSPVA